MDNNTEFFVTRDMENGLLTGAACHVNHPDIQKWKDIEMCVMGVKICKMKADDFIGQLGNQGIDFEKYIESLESR